MNCYSTLDTLKDDLGISSTTNDSVLLRTLEAASRAVDRFCNRHFYAKTETRYFDGSVPLFINDLLSVTTLKTDDDGDGTFENTFTTSDYILYPLNEYPKTMIKLSPESSYGGFGSYRKGCEIEGLWGYGDGKSATPYSASSITVTVGDASGTTLTLSAEGTIETGHTILVEDEQMYISAVTSDGSKQATAERGVNGTTGVAHSAKTASIYEYPADIVQGCLMVAERLFETRGSRGYESEKLGDYSYKIAKGLTDDEKSILGSYRRNSV
jgi:hypothetical protein